MKSEKYKTVDGVVYKRCSSCKEWIENTLDNYYKWSGAKDGLHAACKKCHIEQSKKRQKAGGEELLATKRKWYRENRDLHRGRAKRWDDANKEWRKEYNREYRKQNTEKVNSYSRSYQARKAHDISASEWKNCLRYFNHSCAYCGMNQKEHKKKYGVGLHKEHLVNDGRNNLKNTVPSCQTCNSEKNVHSFNNWYNPSNPKYNRLRYLKIYYWIKDHCHMFIEKKKRNKRKTA